MTVVRDLRWQDIRAVHDIELRAFPLDGWSEASFWAELAARPRRSYRVAEDEGVVRGYAGLDLAGETADVMTIAVDPLQRGGGLGAMLLRDLLRIARDRRCAQVTLEVRADNDTAARLYRRHGFEHVHTRPRYYGGGVDAHVLRRELSGD